MLIKIKAIFKDTRYLLIFLLIVLIISLAFIKITSEKNKSLIQIPSPSLPQIKEPVIEKETINQYKINNIRFIGQASNFPEQINLFKTNNNQPLNNICQQIADQFNLNIIPLPEGKTSPVDIWTKNDFSLTCDREKNRIEINILPYSDEKPNLEIAKKIAQSFSEKIQINLNSFTLTDENVEYFQIENLSYFPSDQKNADIIDFKYQKLINSLPIFQSYSDIFPLEIFVGPDNSIVKIKYHPIPDQIEETDIYPLINISEAVKLLNQGKGKLISLEYLINNEPSYYEEIPLDITSVSSASLNQVKLVYFYSTEEKLLIPGYIFSGDGIASDQKKITLTLFIPALDPQYLTP